MLLKKTEVGEKRACGLILKPFYEAWTFTPQCPYSNVPQLGEWIVIPLRNDGVKIYDDYLTIEAYTNEHYVVETSHVTIVGLAMIILVRLHGEGYPLDLVVNFPSNNLSFNRNDLYTAKMGIQLSENITLSSKHLAISSHYGIFIRNGEANNEKPFFDIQSGMQWKIEKSSGMKSGQFIL